MADVPFWTYESRREKRARGLEQLNRLAESVRPQIEAGDFETAATTIGDASSQKKTDYQRKLDSIMAGRGAPKTPSTLAQTAPVAVEEPKKKTGGGLFGKLKDVGGALADIPGVGEAAHVANVGLQKLNAGSEAVQGAVVAPFGDLKLDASGKPTREFSKRSFVGGLEEFGKDLATLGLAGESRERIARENAMRRGAGESIGGGNLLDAFSRVRREGRSVQESNLPTGVKVGLNIAADPAAWIGPGALKAVTGGARLGRAGRVAGALLEQPASVTVGAALGAGGAAQLAESTGHRNLVPLAALGGGLVGGVSPSVLRRAPGAAVALDARINEPAGSRVVTAGSSAEASQPGITVYHGTAGPLRGGALEPNAHVTSDLNVAAAMASTEARLNGGQPQVYAFKASPGALKPTGVDDLASTAGGTQLVADPSKLSPAAPPPPPTVPPTGSPGGNPRRYNVPEIGQAGAEKAIADKTLVLGTETGWENAPPIFRKGAALIKPSLEQDRPAYLAFNARLGARAQLQTSFDAVMEPHVAAVEKAMEASPAVYIGPEKNAIKGTFKDIADHPDHYIIPPQLRQALDNYDKANWDAVSARARGEYGVDVEPFDNGIPGSVYAPTVPKRDAMETKIEAASASLSSKSRAKQRAYAGAYDRMAKNPEFVPETGIRELTAIHNQAMAANAANETFKLGAGGKSRIEVVDELHPGLRDKKETVKAAWDNARKRLATAEGQQGTAIRDFNLTAAEQRAVDARMESLTARIEALGDEYGPELSYLSGQVYELRAKAAQLERTQRVNTKTRTAKGPKVVAAGAKVESLTDTVDTLQAKVSDLVKAYQTAGTEPYVYDPTTFRYYTPEAAKSVKQLMATASGFGKGLLDTLDESRAFHLAGDASPLWTQSMIGVSQDPIMAIRTVGKMLGENPSAALQRIAREEADDVAEFTFHTATPFAEPIAELRPPKGLARVPKLGAMEKDMFAVVRRIQYEQWKNDRDILLKMNPDMDRRVAARSAANEGSKIIPSLSTAERGVSGLRGSVERGLITSTSFAASPALLLKDMTTGIAKLIASTSVDPATRWRGLTGVEQLALMRGMTMIGTLTTASLATAALAAPSRGMSPVEAMKEALNPDSRYFMAIQLGKGASVPIGGPFRGFVKALYPGEHNIPGEKLPQWGARKFTAPISGTYSLLTNKDWKGDTIAKGNALEQLLRTVSYAAEQIVPISAGTALEGVRAGLKPGEIAFNSVGGLLGSNAALPSPTERLNQKARQMFPGQGGYYNLEPAKQKAIRDANPDLWNEAVARGSDQRKRAEELKQQALKEQQGDDSLVLSGKLSPEEWKKGRDDRRTALYAARSEAYGGGAPPDAKDPVLRGYYAAIDASKVNGRIDWEQVDAYKASLSEAEQKKIADNTGLGGTPLERLRSSLSSAYYQLPSYRGYTADQARKIDELWTLARNNAKSADDVYMLRALKQVTADGSADPLAVKGARKRILGILSEAPNRKAWLKQHPEAVIFRAQAPLNAAQIDAVKKALPTG